MKYRELKPNEIEAYQVGYKVGARQIIIADIEFESDEEKTLYRKGYNAGCQDRLRSNVSNVSKITQTPENKENLVSNVSNVSNVKPIIVNTIANTSVNNNSREYTSSLSTTHVNTFTPPTEQEVLDYAADQNQFASAGGFACPPEIAQAFYDYYSSTGWTLSNDARTPILNWKPKLRQWATNPKYKPKEEPEEEWHL